MADGTTIEPTTLAYLAGVVDSDGCITIHRSTHAGVRYYAARVSIAGTRREPHDLAASLWGGRISRHIPRNPRHRIQYQWSRTGDSTIAILSALRPYLRVKVVHADLALEVQEYVVCGRGDNPYPWNPPDYDPKPYLEECRHEMVSVLNQCRRAPYTRPEEPLKQWGGRTPKLGGRLLDGRTWDEYPREVSGVAS